jgi:hypothetical protein
MLEQLAAIIRAEDPDLKFAILEIGALSIETSWRLFIPCWIYSQALTSLALRQTRIFARR